MAKRLEDLARKCPSGVLQFLCREGVGRDGDFDPDSDGAELPPMSKREKARLFQDLTAGRGNPKQHHDNEADGGSRCPEWAKRASSKPGPWTSFRKQKG